MNKLLSDLQQHREIVEKVCDKIECGDVYMENLKAYLPSLNQMVITIFNQMQSGELFIDLNQNYVLQVLNDIIYGIEKEDSVFLLDVLRYGLLEIYDYIAMELQSEECYE